MANNYPQKALKFIMDTIFPVRWVGCGAYDAYLCGSCLAGVRIKNDSDIVGAVQVFAAASYGDGLVEKTLKMFKYGFVKDLAGPVSDIARTYIDNLPSGLRIFAGNPLLVPVPLHKRRLNWRGFNQSEVLAEKIAGAYGLELGLDILARTKNSKPQADTENRDERLGNVAGVFRCGGDPKNRNIVLVDDICTTGATINECAKILAAKGAGKIKALVIARG